MRRLMFILILIFLPAGAAYAGGFTLTSPDVSGQLSQDQVYNRSGCTGRNISPALSWKNAPEGTESFAVTVYDPDAPAKGGWWHWIIFNIPASVHELNADAGNPEKNIAPAGSVQGVNSYGNPGYGGACPPKGTPHRYVFTVYALETAGLDLDPSTPPARAASVLQQNALTKTSLTATYGR